MLGPGWVAFDASVTCADPAAGGGVQVWRVLLLAAERERLPREAVGAAAGPVLHWCAPLAMPWLWAGSACCMLASMCALCMSVGGYVAVASRVFYSKASPMSWQRGSFHELRMQGLMACFTNNRQKASPDIPQCQGPGCA